MSDFKVETEKTSGTGGGSGAYAEETKAAIISIGISIYQAGVRMFADARARTEEEATE